MRTATTKFKVKSEEDLAKLMERLSAVNGNIVLSKETVTPPHRNALQRFGDWLAGTPVKEPEVLYSFSSDAVVLIDGKYNPSSIAEQIMRLIPAGETASLMEIDRECGEARTISINNGMVSTTSNRI